jgi:uncharacterized protein
MPAAADYVFALLVFVGLTLFEIFVFFPRFRAAVRRGDPNARRSAYRRAVLGQWSCTAVVVVGWLYVSRPWSALRLTAPGVVQLILSIAVLGALIALALHQTKAIGRLSPERLAAIRPKLGELTFMLPHNPLEYRWFMFLSVTAGICEEVLYRGYLVWLLRGFTGVPLAFLASVLLFGAGHLYQGRSGALKATLAGVAMSLIVLATGWLIPAMFVHAAIDAGAGLLGYRVLSGQPAELEAVAA